MRGRGSRAVAFAMTLAVLLTAPTLAPATAKAPTSALLNTEVAGAANRVTSFERLWCIVRMPDAG